ncbi:MAG: hypothetical protein ACTTIF_03955, partial [Prevotella sp.]
TQWTEHSGLKRDKSRPYAATANDGRHVNPYGCRPDRLNMIKLRPESPGNGHRVSPIIPTTVYNIYKVKNNPSGVGA